MKIAFVGAPSCGKAQPLYSRILTPSGWTTFGEVCPGQQICTPNGETALVKAVFDSGIRPVYRVTMIDARSMECCNEHLFKVCSTHSNWNRKWHLMTCDEMREKMQSAGGELSLPLTHPPSLRFSRNLRTTPIPPYTLGVLLGDGGLTKDVRFTTHDIEIKEQIEQELDSRLRLSERGDHDWCIVRRTRNDADALAWKNYLENVGLAGCKSEEKFIPDEYKFLTTEERLQLIQGLMDTDGTVTTEGYMSFTTTSPRLRDDVIFLIQSIGGRVSWSSKTPSYSYNDEIRIGREAYIVYVTCRSSLSLFRLSRKKDRLKEDSSCRHGTETLRIKSIDYVAELPVRCILIDHPDRLYITDDFIVTHNTTLATDVFTQLKQSGRHVELAYEFVRYDIQRHGPMRSIWEQYRTRQHQKELEDAVPNSVDYIIVDGGLLLPYFFAVLYADPGDIRQRLVLQDMYRYFLDDLYLQRYDLVFYLPLLPGRQQQDGTRYQSDAEINLLDDHMRLMFTKLHRLPTVWSVNAGFDQRLNEVMWKILGADYLTLRYNTDTLQEVTV